MNARSKAGLRVSIQATIALIIIWGIAGAVAFSVRPGRPTAASVIAFLREQDLSALSAAERERIIREAAVKLNALTYQEMREVRMSRAMFNFYRPLHPLEKERFAAMIVPTGLARILEASRDMPAGERERFLESAFYYAVIDLSTANPPINPQALNRIEREALVAYERSLSEAERKAMEPQLQQVRAYLNPAK